MPTNNTDSTRDAVRAEIAAIVAWLRKHGMRQTADAIERGEHRPST